VREGKERVERSIQSMAINHVTNKPDGRRYIHQIQEIVNKNIYSVFDANLVTIISDYLEIFNVWKFNEGL